MQQTNRSSDDSPIVQQQDLEPELDHRDDIACFDVPSRSGKTVQDRFLPRAVSFDESAVVAEVSEWQSTAGIRTAQKAGLFLGVMLSLLLIPVGPWQWFPNQAAGVVLGFLLWTLTLLSASIVLAGGLTILVLCLPSRPFRFEVRRYRDVLANDRNHAVAAK